MKKVLSIALGLVLVSGVFATDDKKNKETATTKTEMVSISGLVLDNITGEPIAGAEIRIEGTSVSTYTDINGNYSINIANNNQKVNISFISYKDAIIELNTLKTQNAINLIEE